MDGARAVRREVTPVEGIGRLCVWNGHPRGSSRYIPGESVLIDRPHRSSRTNRRSRTFSHTLCMCWSSPGSDPCDQRTGTFLACRRMSGCWWKSVGTGSQAPGLTPQTSWSSLRRLLVVGSPQLPKRSRVSVSVARPARTTPRQNLLTRCQRSYLGRSGTWCEPSRSLLPTKRESSLL